MSTRYSYREILLAVFLLPYCSHAASGGKYGGEFFSIGVGGRALGLGGAYTALANDVTAGYWNPAGLSKLMYPQLILMHDERANGFINYDYGAVALPISANTSLAFSAIRLGVDDIANTTNAWNDLNHNGIPESNEIDYSKISYYNTADWALYISYAKKASEQFAYGANLKFIRREQGVASATGVGFDLAAQYQVSDKIVIGANFQDVTTTFVAWSTGTNELISPTLKLGSSYFIDAFGGRFAPAIDVDVRFENRQSASNAHLGSVSFDFHTGMEFDFHNLFAVRTGYNDIGMPNLGAGVHLPKFDIDYAYTFSNADQTGTTHRISLTFILQAEQFVRRSE